MARCFHAWLAYTRRVWALRRHCARKLLVWHRHTRALCAARYRFRVMFWPFYVWAREVGQVVVARAKARFLHAVWDTYVQLHSLRQWRAMARRRGRLRARAGRVIHRRLWHVAHRCLRCLAAYRAERIAKRRLWWEQGAVLRRMLDQRLLARCMVLLRVHAAGWQSARELPRRLAHAYTRHDQLRADHALSWLPQPPSAAEAYPWAPTVAATACLRATKAPVEGMRAYFHRELRGRVLVHASILRRVGPRCLAALRRHAVFQKQERFSAHLGALAIMRRCVPLLAETPSPSTHSRPPHPCRSFRRLFLGARHRPLLRLRLSEEQQAELARKDREAKTRVRRAQESGADERSNDDLAWERQRKRHQVAAASARDLARSLRAARSRAATESAASEGHNAVVSQRVSAMRRARERVVGQVGAEAAEAGRALRQEAEALMHERGEALVEALYRVKAAMDDAYTREVAAAAFTELRWKVLHRRASRHATRCKLRRWLALCAQLRRLDRSMPRYYRLRLKWRHFRAWLRFVRARYAVLPVGLRQRAVRLRGHALAFSKLLDAGADPSSASTDLQLLFSRWEEAAAMSAAHRAVVSLCTARRERRLTRRVLWCWNTGTRPYAHYARRRAVEDEHDSRLRRWWLTLDLWHTLMLRRTRTRTSRWMQRCNAFVRTKMIQRTRRVFTLKVRATRPHTYTDTSCAYMSPCRTLPHSCAHSAHACFPPPFPAHAAPPQAGQRGAHPPGAQAALRRLQRPPQPPVARQQRRRGGGGRGDGGAVPGPSTAAGSAGEGCGAVALSLGRQRTAPRPAGALRRLRRRAQQDHPRPRDAGRRQGSGGQGLVRPCCRQPRAPRAVHCFRSGRAVCVRHALARRPQWGAGPVRPRLQASPRLQTRPARGSHGAHRARGRRRGMDLGRGGRRGEGCACGGRGGRADAGRQGLVPRRGAGWRGRVRGAGPHPGPSLPHDLQPVGRHAVRPSVSCPSHRSRPLPLRHSFPAACRSGTETPRRAKWSSWECPRASTWWASPAQPACAACTPCACARGGRCGGTFSHRAGPRAPCRGGTPATGRWRTWSLLPCCACGHATCRTHWRGRTTCPHA